MNWDRVEGNWKQMKGKAREQWGKLTDSDWEQVAGKKDQLVGRIQERYGESAAPSSFRRCDLSARALGKLAQIWPILGRPARKLVTLVVAADCSLIGSGGIAVVSFWARGASARRE